MSYLGDTLARSIVRKPTHSCKDCGALWVTFTGPKYKGTIYDGGWSLVSKKCGACCDNSADFLDKMVPL